MPIEPEPIITICCSDVAGQLRGKGFPLRDLASRRQEGVGWTHTQVMINCLGRIPVTPFGPRGDLLLVPAGPGVELDFGDGPVERWVIGEIRTLDGGPWDCCLRSVLRRALAELEAEGLRLVAAFEHEMYHEGAPERTGDSYAISRVRGVLPYVEELVGALRANGLEPETVLPEYGPRQIEFTVAPAPGLEAADRAINGREIARAVAHRHGSRVSFAPVVTRGVVGNGVHVHFSLADLDGHPVTYDPGGPGGLSPRAASFAAGILRHGRALCAVTAPSVLSYERLAPGSWSSYWTNLGWHDREAMLRICPVPGVAGVDPAVRCNLEFRAADAAASPHLLLAMLAFAGAQGVREGLAPPAITDGDPADLGDEGRRRLGIQALPRSLDEALHALEQDAVATGWLGPVLTVAYLLHKRGELGMLEGRTPDELVALYAGAY